MNPIENTANLFANGLNCSQAIMIVFGKPFGLDTEMATKIGRPWGGGMGHLAQTCGALTAAIMVLGLANTVSEEGQARKETFESVRLLFQSFEEKFGTTVCKNLLGEDLNTEVGARRIREQNLVRKVCPKYVRTVAEILTEIVTGKKEDIAPKGKLNSTV